MEREALQRALETARTRMQEELDEQLETARVSMQAQLDQQQLLLQQVARLPRSTPS